MQLLLAGLIPSLLLGVAVLVLVGPPDADALVSIISRLPVVSIIIGVPVVLMSMILSPRTPRGETR